MLKPFFVRVFYFFVFLLLLEREQTTDMTERKHTIVLLRPNKNTRTYFEYDTVSAAMDGKERAAPTLERPVVLGPATRLISELRVIVRVCSRNDLT